MLTDSRHKPKVLFLCTGNSCRSQMAEGWARALKGDMLEPYSAGIEKHGLNPHAVRVMQEAGIDISGQRSKTVDELERIHFDLVVTVCGHADEYCPAFPSAPRVMHVGFDDPPKLARDCATDEEALVHYRRVRDQIRAFVERLPAEGVRGRAVYSTAVELRAAIRAGRFTAATAGQAPGYVQTNLVILPAADAEDFACFCQENDRPCPLIEQTVPGCFEPRQSARHADLRTDVPRYRVFREGVLQAREPTDIRGLWRDDFVGFLLGCSFTFETALIEAGLGVRHIEEGRNVPMYRTSVPCTPAGKFAGPLVVSMRPYLPEQVEQVIEITSRYPTMHGAPIHVGDPSLLGIADLARPDFGDAVTVRDGEIPVFWACGVTPQLALAAARPPLAITHSPGCMFVTDLRDEVFRHSPQ